MDIPAGEICVLVGPSGCGKTTTMRMINRLIDITDGRHPARRQSVRKLDRPSYGAHRLRHPADRPVPAHDDRGQHRDGAADAGVAVRHGARVDELLDRRSRRRRLRQRYPRQLSGGQRQRVGVARALWPRTRRSC